MLENARRRAAQQGITLSGLIEHALHGHLAATATPFHLHTVRGRLVEGSLDLGSGLAALDDEDEYVRRRT